jgi:hypothetical protein
MTTVPQIREAMATLAGIIEASPTGDKYWPIFERLERELSSRDTRAARLAAAKAAVRGEVRA